MVTASPIETDWTARFVRSRGDGSARNGNDFAKLICDLVRGDDENSRVEVYAKAGGNDGLIDVYDPATGTVWQCKLPQEGGESSTVERAFSAWRKDAATLQKNLAGATPPPGSPEFEPWYRKEFKISKFVFCVGAELASTAKRQELKEKVSAGLERAFSSSPKLTHRRKAISVEVWHAADIDTFLRKQSNVRLQWFKRVFPSVVESIDSWKGRMTGGTGFSSAPQRFQAYLFEPALPYVELTNVKLRPASIMDRLDESQCLAVLLHGEGGHGKTRLAVEAGFVAQRKGWTTLIAKVDINASHLDEIAATAGGSRILIILDYAERVAAFGSILQRVSELQADGAHIRVLATCRPRHWHALADAADGITAIEVTPDAGKDVVRLILGAELEPYVRHCKTIPVFAAFVRLLYDRGQRTSLQTLLGTNDFRTWLRNHVRRMTGDEVDKFELAALLAAMPTKNAIVESMAVARPAIKSYSESLMDDGWLNYEVSATDEWTCAHDLLVDGALLDLFDVAGSRDYHGRALLDFALRHDSVANTIQALARLAHEDILLAIKWPTLFTRLAGNWGPYVADIATSGLIAGDELIKWLESGSETKRDLVQLPQMRVALSRALREANLTESATRGRWHSWVTATVEALSTQMAGESASFLGHWLRASKAPAESLALVEAWINNFGGARSASFVYRYWLITGGKSVEIDRRLMLWLDANSSQYQSMYVITAWLESGRNFKVVEPSIGLWLRMGKFLESHKAYYVHRSWLGCGATAERFLPELVRWFELHAASFDAIEVMTAWLSNAKRTHSDPSSVSQVMAEYVAIWLRSGNNSLHKRAHYLYLGWINAGGDIAVILPDFLAWLKLYAIDSETEQLLNAYLVARYPYAAIEFAVTAWLTEYIDDPRIAFLIGRWLASGGEPSAVEAGVMRWMSHPDSLEHIWTPTIFRHWIKGRGTAGIDQVRKSLVAWLEKHGKSDTAASLLGLCVKHGGVKQFGRFALDWLSERANKQNVRAIQILTAWMSAGGELLPIEMHVIQWLDIAQECDQERRKKFLATCLKVRDAASPRLATAIATHRSVAAIDFHASSVPLTPEPNIQR